VRYGKLIIGLILLTAACHYLWLLYRGAERWLVFEENLRLKSEVLRVRALDRELAALRELNRGLRNSLGEQFNLPEKAQPGVTAFRTGEHDFHPGGAKIPSSNPVAGVLSRRFSRRGWPEALDHPGIDLACALGAPVYAAASGTVLFSDWTRVWGNLVILYHGEGMCTWYGHLEAPLPELGRYLGRGELLGLAGSSGTDEGAHLHYAVQRDGQPVDPMRYLRFNSEEERRQE